MKCLILLTLAAVAYSLEVTKITGTIPPSVPCPDSLCSHRPDGNYNYEYYGVYRSNYFLQCSNGLAYCQPCFPLSLEFSERCNQCLDRKTDDCVSTKPWAPATTFECPDKCPHRGSDFSGNIEDPNNAHQYVACFHGQTVGCVACPRGLLFNEKWNACLYEGKFKTAGSNKSKH